MERQLEEQYVKTGKASLTYKYFPIVDIASQRGENESHWAAQAAECANLQGKFWEYHDKLFAVWAGENVGTYTKAKLKQYAAAVNLNTAAFDQCLDSDQTLPVVRADLADANRQSLQGTPTFFVNGQLLRLRSITFTEFARLLDPLLK